nr:hypothetical protein [Micromonospora sp. DSM 115978]
MQEANGGSGLRTAQFRALAIAARGRADLWRGHGEAASDNLRTAAQLARGCGLPATRTSSAGALALLEALRGRLRAAQAHAAEVIESVAEAGLEDARQVPGWREAQLALA